MQKSHFLRREALGGLVMILVGAGFLALSLTYPLGTPRRIGAGVFPAIVAGLLLLVGAIVFLRALMAPGPGISRVAWRPLLLIVGGIAAFAFLLPSAGFLVATVALIVLSAAAHPGFNWPGALALAAVVAIFGAAVFIYGLGLPLPLVGPLFGI